MTRLASISGVRVNRSSEVCGFCDEWVVLFATLLDLGTEEEANMIGYKKQWDPKKLKLTSRNKLRIELSGYAGANRLEIPFFALVGRSREPNFSIIAGIHGDEYEGVAVLLDLAREIDPRRLRGTLTLVPAANPQAFHAGSRRNPVDLGDLNRSFPGKP